MNDTLTSNSWLIPNIHNKGPLGAQYPIGDFYMETDTTAILWLLKNGLGSGTNPEWGSWGGRYTKNNPYMVA